MEKRQWIIILIASCTLSLFFTEYFSFGVPIAYQVFIFIIQFILLILAMRDFYYLIKVKKQEYENYYMLSYIRFLLGFFICLFVTNLIWCETNFTWKLIEGFVLCGMASAEIILERIIVKM